MEIRYVGPHDAVEVAMPDGPVAGASVVVERDGVIDVPAVLGKSLLMQGENWQAVRSARTSKQPAEKPGEEE